MTDAVKFVRLAVLAVSAALLAGCGQSGAAADKTGNFLVSPGKYEIYNCAQLAVAATALAEREKKLGDLIARVDDSASGNFVSFVAYKPEYYQVQGEMSELRSSAATKKCNLEPAATVAGGPEPAKTAR